MVGKVLQHQKPKKEDDGGGGEEDGVETVEHTTMPGHELTRVFHADSALEQALHQVAKRAEDNHYQAE